MQNSGLRSRMTIVYWSQPSSVVLSIQNCDFSIRITSPYGSQTSPVVLCMKNRVIRTRITSLHGSQTSPVILFLQNKVISIRITSLSGSQPSCVIFEHKTTHLESDLQVSMGPSPHLWFLNAKQRFLDQYYKSLLVPDFAC